eukprot:scaffold1130_cov74-Phaeocystis_antarctica.AAC.1
MRAAYGGVRLELGPATRSNSRTVGGVVEDVLGMSTPSRAEKHTFSIRQFPSAEQPRRRARGKAASLSRLICLARGAPGICPVRRSITSWRARTVLGVVET